MKELKFIADEDGFVEIIGPNGSRYLLGCIAPENRKRLFSDETATLEKYNIALCCSAGRGFSVTTKFLLKNGADVNAYHDCALRYAVEEGYVEIAKFLLRNGANARACEIRYLRNAEIINLLLTYF